MSSLLAAGGAPSPVQSSGVPQQACGSWEEALQLQSSTTPLRPQRDDHQRNATTRRLHLLPASESGPKSTSETDSDEAGEGDTGGDDAPPPSNIAARREASIRANNAILNQLGLDNASLAARRTEWKCNNRQAAAEVSAARDRVVRRAQVALRLNKLAKCVVKRALQEAKDEYYLSMSAAIATAKTAQLADVDRVRVLQGYAEPSADTPYPALPICNPLMALEVEELFNPAQVEHLLLSMRGVSRSYLHAVSQYKGAVPRALSVVLHVRPVVLPTALVDMLNVDGLGAPTFEPLVKALVHGEPDVQRAIQWRIAVQNESRTALHCLQHGNVTPAVSATIAQRRSIAELMLEARSLQTLSMGLLPKPGSAELALCPPHFLMLVHAGKPGDLFCFHPWKHSRSSGGDCKGHAAIAKAQAIALPSLGAMRVLKAHPLGQVLCDELQRGFSRSLARPSRFALVLCWLERMRARMRLLNQYHRATAFEAAIAFVSAQGYCRQGLDLLGIELESTSKLLSQPQRQLAMSSVHAIHEVWQSHLHIHAKAPRSCRLECVDSWPLSHRHKNTGDIADTIQGIVYSQFTGVARMIVDGIDPRATIFVANTAGARPVAMAAYAARLHSTPDICAAALEPEHCLCTPSTVVVAIGRTTDAYSTKGDDATRKVTVENLESLNALRLVCLGGSCRTLLCLFGHSLHNGASGDGKLVTCPIDYPTAPPAPHYLKGRPGVKQWTAKQEVIATQREHIEDMVRMATAHLVAHLAVLPQYLNANDLLAALAVPDSAVELIIANHGIERLMPQYRRAWARLRETGGPFQLFPAVCVKATPTRWDLATICQAEAVRERASQPPLVCVAPPNEFALRNGILREELGTPSAPLTQRWSSPYAVLSANLRNSELTVSLPPLWFPEGTAAPPSRPTAAQHSAALEWWRREGASKRGDKGGVRSAANGPSSRTVLPKGIKRQCTRSTRLAGYNVT